MVTALEKPTSRHCACSTMDESPVSQRETWPGEGGVCVRARACVWRLHLGWERELPWAVVGK